MPAKVQPDADDEVILEPSEVLEYSASARPETQANAALVAPRPGRSDDEMAALLHDRLKAAAWVLTIMQGVLLIWALVVQSAGRLETYDWFVPAARAARVLFCGGIALFLSMRETFRVSTLRMLEIVLFGTLVVMFVVTQYYGNLSYLSRGDVNNLIVMEKNGVLQIFGMMMIYGVFIPNDPRRTARVIAAMAIGPLLVLSVLLEEPLMAAGLVSIPDSLVLAGSNALYLTMGAGLAIYSAFLLNRLRRRLRAALKLGQYQLGERLAEGGMGEVYVAEHQLLKRPCALKLIKPEMQSDPLALQRFEREVQSTAVLSHPNSIQIFDYGHTDDGTFYYVMELLPGLSSADLVRQSGPMPPGRAVYLMRQVCGALCEAHRMGIVHRDLKPANIFVSILGGACDVAKVLDYGLVKLTAADAPELSSANVVSGTPLFMSPEQAMAAPELDHRTDLYALGGILYYWVTGQPPFQGRSATELMLSHARDPVVPPSSRHAAVPADLEAVILRCLLKNPSERYQDARTLGEALEACACAADWDAKRAAAWWTQRAETEIQAREGAAAAYHEAASTEPYQGTART